MNKVIDNALPIEQFLIIKNAVESNTLPWFHQSHVSYVPGEETEIGKTDDVPMTPLQKKYNYYLNHTIFEKHMIACSETLWDLLIPIFEIAEVKSLIRCKINYFPQTHELVHHKKHRDAEFPHKGAIFYLNNNDGLTILEDGTEIENLENRLLLFDSSKDHNGTTCTNADRRLLINFSYF